MDFTIGELSKQGGISSQTIRYYERQQLVGPKYRTDSGYRVYDEEALRRLGFIKHAKDVGFTLKEIKELLGMDPESREGVLQIRGKTVDKLKEVQDKIEELQKIENELSGMVEKCEKDESTNSRCQIIKHLEN
ncbi:MAG: heavy metal-responsive transcriptional regulator [Halobacteriovoraceae bacterium]|jgi:DNA-binding transcriptional MerR regulator|nr:heavy metal-responsive transcriptional regulator [Halobacteriovoraceae bacterium]